MARLTLATSFTVALMCPPMLIQIILKNDKSLACAFVCSCLKAACETILSCEFKVSSPSVLSQKGK